jgi:dynein heavy chain
MASAFISYAGPFNKKFRERMINDCFVKYIKDKHIPMTVGINPVKLLIDESTIAVW